MPPHSHYDDYVALIAQRDNMVMMITLIVLIALFWQWQAVQHFGERAARIGRWLLVGGFYATFALMAFVLSRTGG